MGHERCQASQQERLTSAEVRPLLGGPGNLVGSPGNLRGTSGLL